MSPNHLDFRQTPTEPFRCGIVLFALQQTRRFQGKMEITGFAVCPQKIAPNSLAQFGALHVRGSMFSSPSMASAVSAFELQILFCPQVRSLSNGVARRSMMGFSEGSDAENGFDRGR